MDFDENGNPDGTETLLFDFRDGNGLTPARRHKNGGGWVALTATVEDCSLVSGNAWVSGNARVSGNAWVRGDARVRGDESLSGGSHV